jgi:hypothetical protein
MSGSVYGTSMDDASFRAVQRRLAARLPGVRAFGDGIPLELRSTGPDQPRLVDSHVVEGHAMRAVRVDGDPVVGFAAFLDGTQRSEVLCYPEGLPVVHGTVAAVVRARQNRRMRTWATGPIVRPSVYAPFALIGDEARAAIEGLRAGGVVVVDTTEGGWAPDQGPHPASLLERAMSMVQRDRERAEQELAERWCAKDGGTLFIDGGISGTDRIAGAACVAGVVKSHRTLHVPADGVSALTRLARAERSSAFVVASTRRAPVLSWYLRLRDPAGRDPFFGLVRVEAAYGADMRADPRRVSERAEEVSRWVLAEASPLALPDGRWDKMVYGVRDCEEFLRAVC